MWDPVIIGTSFDLASLLLLSFLEMQVHLPSNVFSTTTSCGKGHAEAAVLSVIQAKPTPDRCSLQSSHLQHPFHLRLPSVLT